MKKMLSLLLSFAMVASLVPTPALAEAMDELELTMQEEAADGSGQELTSPSDDEIEDGEEGLQAVPDDSAGSEDVSEEPVDLVGAPAEPSEPEGDPNPEGYGMRATWIDEETLLEYTYYVIDTGTQGETQSQSEPQAALTYIAYVGDEQSVIDEIEGIDEPIPQEEGTIDVTIPSTIEGYTIVELGVGPEFASNDFLMFDYEIRSITVPATVATVHRIKFTPYFRELIFNANCPIVEIPDWFIGSYYPDGSALERVVLPDSVEHIGKYAFLRNIRLTEANIPASVTTIDDFAFSETSLAAIVLPEGLETIGTGAFASVPGKGVATATTLVIPDSVTSVGDYAFANIPSLGWQNDGTYGLGNYPSPSESSFTSITLGSGLRHIGDYAFAYSQATSLVLPAALEDMGAYAFAESKRLESVSWDDLDAVRIDTISDSAFSYCTALRSFDMPVSVTAIDEKAFYHCDSLRDVTLPPGLVSLGDSAFSWCGALETVSIPATLEEWGSETFRSCSALDDLTLSEGLAVVGEGAFIGCESLKSVTIPHSMTRIGTSAFGYWMWGYNYQSHHDEWGSGLEELTILGGDTPLTIGAGAFSACRGLSGKTIILPARVNKIEGGAFVFISDATFEIRNPNIELVEGRVDYIDTILTYTYGAAFTSQEDALLFEDEPYEDEGLYYVSIPDPWAGSSYLQVAQYLPSPNGSVVRYPNTLTRETSPTFWGYMEALNYARTHTTYVDEEGVEHETTGDYELRPTFEAIEITPEEEEIVDPVVEVAGNGRLEVVANGSAGTTANVCVFDTTGDLVASAQAQNHYALITGLEPGTYTVAAFARNAYFSTVGSLDGFAALGVNASQYVRASVTITEDEDAQVEFSVPKMSTATATGLVADSSLAISQPETYLDREFFLTVNFKMAEGKEASTLQVNIPRGLTPTSVSSAKRNYGTSGYNATTRTLTVNLADVDAQNGRIYVGLKATETGSRVVSASVVSDGTTVPVGDASTRVCALKLDLPTVPVQNKTFTVGVNAAPNTQVALRVAGIDETNVSITTNRSGFASKTFDLSGIDTTMSYATIWASVDNAGTEVMASGFVEFQTAQTEVATLRDFTFVHGGQQYYIVRAGRTQPGSKYYTYIANGKESNKYWTFTATYTSAKPLKIGSNLTQVIQTTSCDVQVQMLDGSSRFLSLGLVSSEQQEDESYLTTFAGTLYLDQAGDHVFPTSLVPCAFDVTLDLPGDEKAERTQTDIDALRDLVHRDFEPWRAEVHSLAQENGIARPDASMSAEDAWNTYGWDEDEGYCWIFFYSIEQDSDFWTYYETKIAELEQSGQLEEGTWDDLENYVGQIEAGVDAAAEVFDGLLGAETSITDCAGVGDWVGEAIGYEGGQEFNPTQLEKGGFTVTQDDNAPSAGTAGGTPTNGLGSGTYAEPSGYATKVTKSSDGGVQSVQYRDSNGNGATIPVAKRNDLSWLTPSTEDVLLNAPTDSVISFLDGIDDQINRNMTATDKANLGESKLGKYGRATGKVMNIAGLGMNQAKRIKQSRELSNYYADAAEARGEVGNLEVHLNYLRMHNKVGSRCWKALCDERDWAIIVADGKACSRDWHLTELIRAEGFDILGIATGGSGAAFTYGADKLTGKAVADGMDDNQRVLNPALAKLNAVHLKRLKDCGESEGKASNIMPPILDPSGTVYEAVPSNTLAGVTATVYEVEEGTVSETPWKAEDYGQVNPQVTGSEGLFGWDVPVGSWKVTFSKDGYCDASTDALEVPPPQVGLLVPMISTAAPTVTSITADESTIEIAFSQYMDASDGARGDIALQVGGTAVATSDLHWVDAEVVTADDGTETGRYAKLLRVNAPAGTGTGDTLQVSVAGAKNYAGTALEGSHQEDVTVAARPAKLVFNFEDTISLQTGTSRNTSVRVYDANNQPLEGVRLVASLDNDLFASVDDTDAVTNEDGVAKVQLTAKMPGMSELNVQAGGTAVSRSINLLTTVDENMAARPTVTIIDEESGKTIATYGPGAPAENNLTIYKPARMQVSCATEDATIYYTLDGSCPCQNTSSRSTYTGGSIDLVENADAFFILAAYKDGLNYSERLRINIRAPRYPSNATVELSATSYTYDGSEKKPDVTVTWGGMELTQDKDYRVVYENNTNAGTARAKVEFIEPYQGSITKQFTIQKANQTISASNKECVTKKTVKLGAKRTVGDGALSYTTSNKKVATVSSSGVVKGLKAGTVTITIKAKGTSNFNAATKKVKVKVGKANPIKVKGKTATVKLASLKKANQTVAAKNVVTVSKAQGSVSYKKVSGNNAITVAKSGKVTVKKGLAKGTYSVKVSVTAAGNKSYLSGTKSVTFKIAVK